MFYSYSTSVTITITTTPTESNNNNTNNYSKKKSFDEDTGSRAGSLFDDTGDDISPDQSCQIVRVCQRIKFELEAHELNAKGHNEEIWALLEWEIIADPDGPEGMASPMSQQPKRIKRWKKFDTESELSDFIRRDTGEPLTVPPYSLTPQQSSRISADAEKQVSHITEEFRRFRVKAGTLLCVFLC